MVMNYHMEFLMIPSNLGDFSFLIACYLKKRLDGFYGDL